MDSDRAMHPRVSLVVLTFNRRDELQRTLDHLCALPEQPQITVVDNASVDGTTELLRRQFPTVRHLRVQANIGAAARNLGIARAPTPYVALCDDDTWWEPGSLELAANLLDCHPKLAVITARVLVGEAGRIDPTCTEMARSPLEAPPGMPGKSLLGFLAGASVVRRDAFLSVGGFDPRFCLGGEEELVALDLESRGWSLSYIAEMTVRHMPSPLRDSRTRRTMLRRNALWVSILRRPWSHTRRQFVGLLRGVIADSSSRRALTETLLNLGWLLPERRSLPRRVEERLQLLERARGTRAEDPQVATAGTQSGA